MTTEDDYLRRVSNALNKVDAAAEQLEQIAVIIDEWRAEYGMFAAPRVGVLKQIKGPPGAEVHCCFCLNLFKGDRSRTVATTVISGYAVCDEHLEWLSAHPTFGRPTANEFRDILQQAFKHNLATSRAT
jgi:hypothetical protein